MKRVYAVLITGMCCLFFHLHVKGQRQVVPVVKEVLVPLPIQVGFNKTSNLIFPFAIKSVDRGSSAVMAQKAKGVENILQIKAGKEGFPQTNLSVITADGQFYSFLLDYATEPRVLNIAVTTDSLSGKEQVVLAEIPVNEKALQIMMREINQADPFLRYHTRTQKIRLCLQSIYLKSNLMWFTLQIRNKSLIGYRPDYIRIFLRDKKKGKRTAVQEKELKPLYTSPWPTIGGKDDQSLILAFTPFTIPSTQEMVIQIGEKNGGRALNLPLKHQAVLRARALDN